MGARPRGDANFNARYHGRLVTYDSGEVHDLERFGKLPLVLEGLHLLWDGEFSSWRLSATNAVHHSPLFGRTLLPHRRS